MPRYFAHKMRLLTYNRLGSKFGLDSTNTCITTGWNCRTSFNTIPWCSLKTKETLLLSRNVGQSPSWTDNSCILPAIPLTALLYCRSKIKIFDFRVLRVRISRFYLCFLLCDSSFHLFSLHFSFWIRCLFVRDSYFPLFPPLWVIFFPRFFRRLWSVNSMVFQFLASFRFFGLGPCCTRLWARSTSGFFIKRIPFQKKKKKNGTD